MFRLRAGQVVVLAANDVDLLVSATCLRANRMWIILFAHVIMGWMCRAVTTIITMVLLEQLERDQQSLVGVLEDLCCPPCPCC